MPTCGSRTNPMTLAVTTHVVGLGSGRYTPPAYVQLSGEVSARTLLAEHVRNEVTRSQQQCAPSLALHYMLAANLYVQPQPATSLADVVAETSRAYAGLDQGLFVLMVDGVAVTNLDAPLHVTETSRVGFIRLLPLSAR